ncbi:helix-turn-helix domain-containing protein [Paenibacillus athensensis]|uniref:AraC family transcriptional regulator n=1 Tax=Paenibacillus athensensis TaxID=1967502 RepID=A0A4Y8QAP5_9BACL|nr:AraC family transcriptional regulator [Paenibacillus athensensis]MCD1260050.1 helix-turn-helix domain-containing protein [Paenibacillus athensensis]
MHTPESYYVVSNPRAGSGPDDLLVLFTGESQTKPLHRLGPKVFDYYLIHAVISGRGVLECGDGEIVLGPGDSFVIEPERLVSYVSDEADPWHYVWIAFSGPQASRLMAELNVPSGEPVIRAGDRRRIPLLYRRVQAALRGKRPNASLLATGYLHLLLAAYSEALTRSAGEAPPADTAGDRLVQQAIHYLTTQFAEPITIEQMAEALGYNRAYLSRLFKRHTRVTPVTFLLQLRVGKARQLLRERPELTIEQIAASVGFHDPLYFSKQFRRAYACSPSEYRAQMKAL